MKKKLAAVVALIGALLVGSVQAFEPFVVKDIRVEGIQRVEAGTIFSYLPVKVGERITQEQADEAVRKLFETGFFSDVRIEADGDVLVVLVDERPAIGELQFVGMKEFDVDSIKQALRGVGLAESRIFDRSLLRQAEQELKRQYLSRGYYAVDIQTTITPLPRNRVAIRFDITEGEPAKIAEIKIVGNKAFSEKELLKKFQLTTPGWLTWYTKSDRYSREKLQQDLESLRSFYMNQGYLDFEIESASVSIGPDKQNIYISISVKEGERYTVSAVRFAGNLILPEEEYRKLAQLKPGDVFSREKLNATVKAVTDRLGNEGYAFANVNAAPEIDREKRQVAFTIFVDPGRRTYVHRINVGGNVRTRDEVVRREMRQMEGEWYDAEKINKSKQRIDRLGYFDDVQVETQPVPGTTDQVDVNFTVKEKPTGNLMVGAGFSSSDSVVLSGAVTQDNIFGSGKSLGLQLDTSQSKRTASLSFTDPYYTIDGVSLGYDLYYRTFDPSESYNISRYKTRSMGGGLRMGWPIGEDDNIQFGLAYDLTKIDVYWDSPLRYIEFCGPGSDYDCDGVSSLAFTAGWARDTRDSRIYPMKGRYQRVSAEVDLPPGDIEIVKLSYQHQWWIPITERQALMLNGDIGWIESYGDKDVPFFRNYYVGGIGSVRGFEAGSLGRKDENDDAYGGTRKIVLNAEYYFPLPGMGMDKTFRMSVFVDSGYVWDQDDPIQLNDMRVSTGVGFSWSSPLGPLKFSFAVPLRKDVGGSNYKDDTQNFQFQFGTMF